MTDELVKELVERIHQELDDIPRVLARLNEGWKRACRSVRTLFGRFCLKGATVRCMRAYIVKIEKNL